MPTRQTGYHRLALRQPLYHHQERSSGSWLWLQRQGVSDNYHSAATLNTMPFSASVRLAHYRIGQLYSRYPAVTVKHGRDGVSQEFRGETLSEVIAEIQQTFKPTFQWSGLIETYCYLAGQDAKGSYRASVLEGDVYCASVVVQRAQNSGVYWLYDYMGLLDDQPLWSLNLNRDEPRLRIAKLDHAFHAAAVDALCEPATDAEGRIRKLRASTLASIAWTKQSNDDAAAAFTDLASRTINEQDKQKPDEKIVFAHILNHTIWAPDVAPRVTLTEALRDTDKYFRKIDG